MVILPLQPKRWVRLLSYCLVGLLISFLTATIPVPPAPAQNSQGGQCSAITQPLTAAEMAYAQSAWNYFVDNVQPNTGLSNSAGGFPSGTLWDLGNYLAAMNAALWMGLIDQAEFDSRLNQFLTSLSQLPLFENTLPNKVYNSATGEIVDYGNNPLERGIGWSALDIGRILAAFHIVRTCHPQYADWLAGVVDSWDIAASVQDGMLYGATVLPSGETLKVQEGRLGYEEYAARGYALWGFDVPQAVAYEPFKFVDIYGLQIPVDTRNYQDTNANNYVVSESYILDAIEFGLQGEQADFARRVFEAQKRRYEDTGLLTAVSEDNINQPPYFLYSTVFSNGVPWAVITEANELHPELRTLCTKAAFGWRYVYPDDPYAQQIFDHVKDTTNSGRGFYAGIYESGLYEAEPPLNDILTGNTNGLILEILYYKARGFQPMLSDSGVPTSSSATVPFTPDENTAGNPPPPSAPTTATPPPPQETQIPQPIAATAPPTVATPQPPETSIPPEPQSIAIAPIRPVGLPKPAACPLPQKTLSITDRRYAETAWQYFEANHQPSGLVPDRSDVNGTTLWGIGDYLSALHAAQAMEIITLDKFDERVRHLLGALQEIPLFAGELPHRAYSTLTLDPIDYGGNDSLNGNGWSGLDVGRLLAALHTLKTCHPEYTDVVDTTVLDWSYLRVVRNGRIANAHLDQNDRGRDRIRVKPADILGYEEYAARAFQLWGFNAERSSVGGNYLTDSIQGHAVPVQRSQAEQRNRQEVLNTISTPFILYGLEFGFDPQINTLVQEIYQAEASRYQETGNFSASGTTLINEDPYVVHSTLVSDGRPWVAVDDTGNVIEKSRVVSTAVAFAYYTLFPNSSYGQELWLATLDLYNPLLGYYEGFYENGGRRAIGFTGGTNSLILQALLHKNTHRNPLIQPHVNTNSPWWQAIREGDPLGLGLPERDQPTIEMVADGQTTYWIARSATAETASSAATVLTTSNTLPNANDLSTPNGMEEIETEERLQPAPAIAQNTTPAVNQPNATPSSAILSFPLATAAELPNKEDQSAARLAWTYFESNWNPSTGMVNGVDGLDWATWWDQGSAILGLHAAYQLGLLAQTEFDSKISRLLNTLQTLPLPSTDLPNKAYSTSTAEMRTLSNQPDPQGGSGWSVMDLARYFIALHTLEVHYPAYRDRIEQINARYDLNKLVNEGWLWGSGSSQNGLQYWQEGRFGYEQYAAYGLKLWGLEAENALYNPPTQTVTIDGFEFVIDQRNRSNSGASNHLTNDPYLLWGLEMGWPESIQPQIDNLRSVQANRYAQTGILTAVNEDSLDREPYFLYYSIYADGQSWPALTVRGRSHPELRFLSTKAAFALSSLFPDDDYCQILRRSVQSLADVERGYLSGRYENSDLGPNRAINVNTNAIILESLLYQNRGGRPLTYPA
ncbi:MAG: DUF3131 domain-containing protein [Leptolyngbya sp. SIO4C5]|nr:DUF3131 domain-containing protein [Leptolyngbya sp. SIO4C5]